MSRITITIRFEPDDLALVDQVRGLMSRQDFVSGATMRLAKHAEEMPQEPWRLPPEVQRPKVVEGFRSRSVASMLDENAVLKPYRAPIGSRLKAK